MHRITSNTKHNWILKKHYGVPLYSVEWNSRVLLGSSKYSIMLHCISSRQQQQCCISRYKWQYLVHTIFWKVESRCSDLHWVAVSSWERTICFFSTWLGKHHYRNTKWSNLTRCNGTRLEPVNIAVYPREKCYCSGVAL